MAYKKKLNIIIFGASGAVGNYILDKFYREKHNLLLFVKDKKKILTIKKRYKPQLNQKIFFENLDVIKKGSIKKKFLKNKKFIFKNCAISNKNGYKKIKINKLTSTSSLSKLNKESFFFQI